MLLRFLRGTGPGVLMVIIIIFSAVWARAFYNPQSPALFNYETAPMPLYGLLKMVLGQSAKAGVIFSFSLVAVIAFLLVRFNLSTGFLGTRSFFPALFYILLSGLFPQYQLLNPVLPASLFLLLTIITIIKGYHKNSINYDFFDAGFILSTGSLFYANLLWFSPLLLIGIAVLREGKFFEFIISVIGLITPYFLLFGIYYVIGQDLKNLIAVIGDNLFLKSQGFHYSGLQLQSLILLSAGVLACTVYLLSIINTKKIKSRKVFALLLSIFLISVVIFLVLPSASTETIWLINIPASFFLSYYFVFTKKKVLPQVFFWVMILIVAMIQFIFMR